MPEELEYSQEGLLSYQQDRLSQLRYIVEKRVKTDGLTAEEERLLGYAISARFQDCVDADCREEAHKILQEAGLERDQEPPLQPA